MVTLRAGQNMRRRALHRVEGHTTANELDLGARLAGFSERLELK